MEKVKDLFLLVVYSIAFFFWAIFSGLWFIIKNWFKK
jgi:hypothetical protein